MKKTAKNRASKPKYVSPSQLSLAGFESPFERSLNPENLWVRLSKLQPWDDLCSIYRKHIAEKETGRPDLNPRLVLGVTMIKHICDLDERETVDQISENIYLQYFLGYSSFCDTPPLDPSLFVQFRKRLGLEQINAINDRIAKLKRDIEAKQKDKSDNNQVTNPNKGSLIMDATACPKILLTLLMWMF